MQNNKLKKEENLQLLMKLSQSKIDTSGLQSSKDLGTVGRRAASSSIESASRPAKIAAANERGSAPAELSGDETDEEDRRLTASETAREDKKSAEPSGEVGSGLKRPLEVGADGFPLIKKRKKRAPKAKPEPVVEIEWEGFDSEGKEGRDDLGLSDDEQSAPASGSDTEGSSDTGQTEDSNGEDDSEAEAPRKSAFKAWAVQQINRVIGFEPTNGPVITSQQQIVDDSRSRPKNSVTEQEPLPPELQTAVGDPSRKAFSVQVDRTEEVQNARLGLPVVGEEQKIMEAVHNNQSVVIWGATGSGKTTQLPQFLFEAGYGNPESPNPGMVGITQPRRVAAVSMARRVADELGQYSHLVSYQIRFESTASSRTAIKFMTDGILLREIAEDFSLSKYSIIIIDEAHERSVNTDILIGMVSRIVDLRRQMKQEDPSVKPLKLVIMSATLRVSDFTQNASLFRHGPPPLVQAEGRQYPVAVHFSRHTRRDYVQETFRKVSRGHRKLPPGGMLVFLTGQSEIRQLSKRLKQAFKPTQRGDASQAKVQISANDVPLETEDLELGGGESAPLVTEEGEDYESDLEIVGLDGEKEKEDDDEEEGFNLGEEAMDSSTRVHILPLYSQLPTKEQLRVFERPPEGSRLIVLATNVAETSLTIPGIRYVFDCGRAKDRQYNLDTGVQSFRIGWISKASADQRAGRAGRTGPGHCYRMYSSAVYESEFAEYTDPEILRTPIEDVVLQMKSMGLHNVINFPFPTPPSRLGLSKAEKLLKNLGALTSNGQVTAVGRCLSTYPLSPRFGKMLYVGHQHGCMPYVIALVSALAVGDLFVPENEVAGIRTSGENYEEEGVYTNADRLQDTAQEKRSKEYARVHRLFSKHGDTSDALKYLSAVCAYGYASDGEKFCEKMFLRPKAFKEATLLRQQLTDIVQANNPALRIHYEARLREPSSKQVKALKQIVTAGFIDNVAIRADLAPVPPDMPRSAKRAIDVPYVTLFRSRDSASSAAASSLPEQRQLNVKAVYVHPSSVLAKLSAGEMPQYIVYSHLQQQSSLSSRPDIGMAKVRMFPLVTPSGAQLSAIAHGTPLIEYGKPIGKVEMMEGEPRRICWVVPSLVGEAGGTGWPLPVKKVIQRRDLREGWVIEKFVS